MQSKIATAAKDALIASAERLSPEERLNAYVAHSRLLVELRAAGARLRNPTILEREFAAAGFRTEWRCQEHPQFAADRADIK
jgi:hypothetical protein